MTTPNDPIRRAALPEVLFAEDVAVALDITEPQAEPLLRRSRFGPFFLVHSRPAVLRDDFLEALQALGRAPFDDREVLP